MKGIRPMGNLLLKDVSNSRDTGLGDLKGFSDEIIVRIISYLSERDLGIWAQVSKATLLYSLYEEIWKEKWRGIESLPHFYHNWRSSWILYKTGKYLKARNWDFEGFYSDYFYAGVQASSMPLDQLCMGRDNIPRFEKLGFQEFQEKSKSPFILTRVMEDWKAMEKWDLEYLEKEFGHVKFKAEAWEIDFNSYMEYCKACNEESPLYLFDKRFGESTRLANDYQVLDIFKDFFEYLGNDRPDYRWIIVGPERSGSSFHKDPNATSAWNAVIKGSKKWILFPPNVIPPGVFPSSDGSEVTSPISLSEWFLNFYPNVKSTCFEGVCNSGELIFVPSGWWHAVINLETSIAITQNFVSQHNLLKVLDFLKTKPDQVSGTCVTDLYSKLYSAIEMHHPELLKVTPEKKTLFTQEPFRFSFF